MTKALAATILAVIVIAAVLAFSSAAEAQLRPIACMPGDRWLTAIADQYGEKPTVSATAGPNVVIFTTNPITGTWTMLVKTGPGMCLVAAGKDWGEGPPAAVEPPEEPEDDPPAAVPQIERLPGIRREYSHPASF